MANCIYNGTEYAPGSALCMAGLVTVCGDDGQWHPTAEQCDEEGKVLREGSKASHRTKNDERQGKSN